MEAADPAAAVAVMAAVPEAAAAAMADTMAVHLVDIPVAAHRTHHMEAARQNTATTKL